MSSYIDQALNVVQTVPEITTQTLQLIEEIDEVTQLICLRMDKLIEEKNKSPSTFSKKLNTELQDMTYILEDMAERKALLAVRNYDFIDKHVHIVDQEIKVLEAAMRLNGYENIINKNLGSKESITNAPIQKRGRGRPSLGERNNSALSHIDGADIDPNEPVYCICRQIAYGEMIACDNEECVIEWFHYSCVNLTKKPKNIWFCSSCRNL